MGDATDIPDIPESKYKPDLELLGSYQAFSAEILRLSLAGLVAVGFLLSLNEKAVGQKKIEALLDAEVPRHLLLVSITLFALASAVALIHRGASSDSMHFHLKILRGLGKCRDFRMRKILFRVSEWAMIIAPILLAIGVLVLGAALSIVLA
jgi:hypothetical protein